MPALVAEDRGGACLEATDRGSELLLVILAASVFQRLFPPVTGSDEFFEDAELDDVLKTWPEPAPSDGDVEVSGLPVPETTTLQHAL